MNKKNPEICKIDSNYQTRCIVLSVYLPIFSFRMAAYHRYKYSDSQEFEVAQLLIRLFYINLYALVTNSIFVFHRDDFYSCWKHGELGMSFFNYALILLFGVQNFIINVPISALCLPLLAYKYFKNLIEFLYSSTE